MTLMLLDNRRPEHSTYNVRVHNPASGGTSIYVHQQALSFSDEGAIL